MYRFIENLSGSFVGSWLAVFVVSLLALITGHQGFFLKVVNYSFFLLVLGVVFYVLESRRSAKD